jgi:hypothetical protein
MSVGNSEAVKVKNLLSFMLLGCIATNVGATQLCQERINLSAPSSRYLFTEGGALVTDAVTGLIWQRCLLGQVFSNGGTSDFPQDDTCADGPSAKANWAASLLATATFNTQEVAAGRSGFWRVPNIKELATTQELKCVFPAANPRVFPGLPAGAFVWSSTTTFNLGTPTTWAFFVDSGNLGGVSSQSNGGYIRLVRDPL